MALSESIKRPLRPWVQRLRRLGQRGSRWLSPWRPWNGEHHPVFDYFEPWQGQTDGSRVIDSLGVRTAPSFRPAYRAQPAGPLRTRHPEPYAPYFELAFVLEAVVEANSTRPLVMLELGAGYGAWLATACRAASRVDRPVRRLIGVEMVPHHLQWMRSHLRENGATDEQVRIVPGAVGATDGELRYQPIEDPAADFGQRVEREGSAVVRAYRLATLIENEPSISLIHCDIQGAELDAFRDASLLLESRVRRILISTHSRSIHRQLREQLRRIGFELTWDFNVRKRERTPFGDVQFLDGLLCAVNPKLR